MACLRPVWPHPSPNRAEGLARRERLLYAVTPRDPLSTTAAVAGLVAAALIACIPPASRAMRVDPVEGLRVK